MVSAPPTSAVRPFVSYSHRDRGRGVVRQLIDDLKRRGVRLWIDESILPGTAWDKSIEEGLRQATHVLFLASPASSASPFVRKELIAATNRNLPIIPVLLETCDLPYVVLDLQWIDFRDQNAYLDSLAQLLKALGVDEPHNPPPASGHSVASPAAALLSAAQMLRQQVTEVTTANTRLQETFRALAQTPRETVSDEDSNILADLASQENIDPQIGRDAAMVIAHTKNRKALDGLMTKTIYDQAGAWRALAHIRAEMALPSDISPSIRRRVFWRVSADQFFGDPLALVGRYAGAALGGALGMGLLQYALFSDPLGVFAAQRENTALALGALYGGLIGFAVLATSEVAWRLRAWRIMGRLIAALLVGAAFCTLAYLPLKALHYQRPLSQLGALPILSLVFVSGFAVASALSQPAWIRALAGSGGALLALFGGWLVGADWALLEFKQMSASEAFVLCAVMALIGGLLAYLPEFVTFVSFRFARRSNRPSGGEA